MNKELNLVEILKDCPKGMELDCTMYDNVTLKEISMYDTSYPIYIETECGFNTRLTKYGQNVCIDDAKCVIFPKGKTTWEGFVPPCQFKDGDIIYTECNSGNEWISIYKFKTEEGLHITYAEFYKGHKTFHFNETRGLCRDKDIKYQRLAIDEEKQQLLEALHSKGYKWNAETKEVEKIEEDKPKWNPDTLQPFDNVLERNADTDYWDIDFYIHTNKKKGSDYPYYCLVDNYKICIPYNEETKHLLGTNQAPPEFSQL